MHTVKKYLALLLVACLTPFCALAQEQTDNQQNPSALSQYQREKISVPYKVKHNVAKKRRVATRTGNKELKKEHYSKAIANYRKAISADSNYTKAQYNRAFSHGKLHQNDTALNYYNIVCKNSSATSELRAKAHYNAGNIHLKNALATRDTGGYDGQSLQKAIEEYKSALRLDSKNRDAQHNLSLAKQLLRPEQQSGGGGGGQNQQNQNQQNKDQNKQKQNQDQQNQDQQKQQQQQNGNQNKQDSKQQEQRRREAEQMLNAMKNNEQQTMKAVRMKEANKDRQQGNPNRIEKDW